MIRKTASIDMPIHIEAPSQIGLFTYDNNTFIVESFRETNAEVTVIVHNENASLYPIAANKHQMGTEINRITHDGMTYFKIFMRPGSHKAFRIE